MKMDSIDAAWAAACAAEPDAMSRDEIAGLLADLRRARAWLDSVEMRATRRMRGLAAVGEAEPPESLLTNAGGHSGREARSIGERDELCAEMPDVEDALATGEVTAGYVDAMAAAARDLPAAVRAEYTAMAEELLRRASQLGLDAFRRECRTLASTLLARSRAGEIDELTAMREASSIRRWRDRHTGMCHTHLELDPVRDARLHSAAKAELARLRAADTSRDRSWDELQVEAFVNAAAGITTPAADDPHPDTTTAAASDRSHGTDPPATATAGHGRSTNGAGQPPGHGCDRCVGTGMIDRVPELTALVSYDWLAGLTDHGTSETENGEPIPIATMRRLACDAEIIPIVLGGDGRTLDEGRSRRTATRDQRRALRAMHRGCAYPDCNVGFDTCRIHHIRWWWHDTGPTDLDNLLPLCERHHHLVHEGGWTLTMTPDRIATWTRPDGTTHHHGTTIDRTTPQQTTTTRRPAA